jgi:multiple sugar transport system ATP-binding protein
VQIGEPLAVYRRPADVFVARFLGSPPMNLVTASLATQAGEPVLRIGAVEIALPPQVCTALPSAATQPGALLLGVRPEDLYAPPPAEVRPRAADITARVVTVEPLGAETLLVLALDGVAEEVIARIGRDSTLRPGNVASIAIDTGALHLFDPVSGRALYPQP